MQDIDIFLNLPFELKIYTIELCPDILRTVIILDKNIRNYFNSEQGQKWVKRAFSKYYDTELEKGLKFDNKLKYGIWHYYNEQAKAITIEEYDNGTLIAVKNITYHIKGTIRSITDFYIDKKISKTVFYSMNTGSIKAKIFKDYKNNILEEINFCESGNILSSFMSKDDKPVCSKRYYDNLNNYVHHEYIIKTYNIIMKVVNSIKNPIPYDMKVNIYSITGKLSSTYDTNMSESSIRLSCPFGT